MSGAVREIGLVAALSKGDAATFADEVRAWLEARGCHVRDEAALDATSGAGVDAVVVLGGDGLMMRVANRYADVPLLGINFGKVGFLAAVERRDWVAALGSLVDGDFVVDEGATLRAFVQRDNVRIDVGWAINDVVIRSDVRMIDIELYLDGRYVNTYPGDGMIVATPRGSTAYCMAAGGPVLTAGVRGFAIVPISCHSPIRTPFVVAEGATIELLDTSEHSASLVLDGRPTFALGKGDTVHVQRGEHGFRMITLPSTSFFEAFRTKFNFQIRPDAVPTRKPTR